MERKKKSYEPPSFERHAALDTVGQYYTIYYYYYYYY